MIVDTSALVAILLREEGHEDLLTRILAEPTRISAPVLVEARVVVGSRLGAAGRRGLESLMRDLAIEVTAFDAQQADIAAEAYRDFGRGSGHPARLNLGDTYTYALAAASDESLLFVGDDFTHTDARSALDEG